MLIVALLALAAGSSPEAEAPHLAGDLGVGSYDARLLLAGGSPSIVLSTGSRERALALLSALRARGHEAAACDAAAIVPSASMVTMRRFRLEAEAIVTADPGERRLPYADILCMLRAWHRQRVEAETTTSERKFDAGRALASGGLVMTKSVTTSAKAKLEDREQVLYLFRRSAETPWLLRANGTSYAGLGAPLAPSQQENFVATIARLRELAPRAAYDERLLLVKRVPEKTALSVAGSTSTIASSSEAGMDVLAHFLALALSREAGGART